MIDVLCDTCGIGYYLPSGVCDHCNQRAAQPTAEVEPSCDVVEKAYKEGFKDGKSANNVKGAIQYFWNESEAKTALQQKPKAGVQPESPELNCPVKSNEMLSWWKR